MKNRVLDTLLSGGTFTGRRLGVMFGIPDSVVRKIINELRWDGVPICSSPKGYYISHDASDVKKTILSMEHRMAVMGMAIDGLKRTVEKL